MKIQLILLGVLLTRMSPVFCLPRVRRSALRTQGFKGDLTIRDLFISNPVQADPTSSYNSTVSSKSGHVSYEPYLIV